MELLNLAKDCSEANSLNKARELFERAQHMDDGQDDLYNSNPSSLASTMKFNFAVLSPGTRNTPLHIAAGSGNVEFLRLILQQSSCEEFINQQNLMGDTGKFFLLDEMLLLV